MSEITLICVTEPVSMVCASSGVQGPQGIQGEPCPGVQGPQGIQGEPCSDTSTWVTDETELRAVIDGITDGCAQITIAQEIPITADLTIPESVNLKFLRCGMLSPESGVTLTVNSTIDAGLWQIFGGNGTVTGTPQIPYVYPEWFGAVGDGITDDVAAVQAALSIPAVIKLSKPYLISDTLSIGGTGCTGMVWEGDARTNRFVYSGTRTAIEVYGLQHATGYEFRVQKSENTWVSEDAGADRTSIGIHFLKTLEAGWVIRSEFNFKYVKDFAYGIKFDGVFTWNKADIGNIIDCWTGMYFDTLLSTGVYQVWNNQNTFIGGEIKFQSSTLLEGVPVTGSTMLHLNGNGNTFLGLCLENNQGMEYIITGDGSSNNFFGTRLEGILPGSIDLRNTKYIAFPNLWVGGYDLSKSKFTDVALYANSVIGGESWIFGGCSANGIYMTNSHSLMVNKSVFKTGHPKFGAENTFVPGKGLTMDIHASKIEMYKGLDGYENPSLVLEGSPNYFGRILFGSGLSGHIEGETPGIQGGDLHKLMISGSAMVPHTDDYMNIGSDSNRFNDIYATNGSIQTSDEREKVDIRDLFEAEKVVALKVKGMLRAFRWKKSVAEKGDDARIHFGVMAQQVAQVFRDEGLDPERYALFCYDEWAETPEITDEEGNVIQQYSPAGNRYGIRYSELLAFVIGAM